MGMSLLLACSLGAAVVGALFHLIGMATPYWVHVTLYRPGEPEMEAHQGLWQFCRGGQCRSFVAITSSSEFNASRAFAVFGLLAGLASVACLLIGDYGFQQKRRGLRLAALVSSVVTVVCLLITVATYVDFVPSQSRQYLAWSFALTTTSLGIFALSVGLISALIRTDPRTEYTHT